MMKPTFPLDHVIRRVSSYRAAREGASEHDLTVIVDADKKRTLKKPPLLGWGRDIRYFIVSRRNVAECQGPSCRLRDLDTKAELRLQVRYEASALPGQEAKLALRLCNDEPPHTVLNRLIEEWVEVFYRSDDQRRDIIKHFFQKEERLRSYLREKASEKAGLHLECRLTVEGEGDLEPYSLDTGFFAVRLDGHNDELMLRIISDLVVDKERKETALIRLSQRNSLKSVVIERIRQFALRSVSYHDFHFNLESKVRPAFRQEVDRALEREGRKTSYFMIKVKGDPIDDAPIELKISVDCTIKGTDQQININNKVILSLKDYGRWHKARQESLQSWCRKILKKTIQEHVFDMEYVDLLLRFDPEPIKAAVRLEAEGVGYDIRHHMVLPALDVLSFPDQFRLEVQRSDFPTKDTRMNVGLKIVVTARIPNLEAIKHLLKPHNDLRELMGKALIEEVRHLMHQIHPERFYMRFYTSGKADEKSVEEELKGVVRKCLKEKFSAEVLSVIPNVLETDLTKRLDALREEHHPLTIRTEPFSGHDDIENVTIRVVFEVLGVSEWYTFRSRSYGSSEEEIKAIKKLLAEDLKSKLETLGQGNLKYQSRKGWIALARDIIGTTTQLIERSFGLSIQIRTFRRLRTEAEESRRLLNQTELEVTVQTHSDFIRKKAELDQKDYLQLRERRTQQMANDMWEEDDLGELERRIEDIEQTIRQKPRNHGRLQLRGARLATEETEDLEEFRVNPLLLPSDRPQLKSESEASDGEE